MLGKQKAKQTRRGCSCCAGLNSANSARPFPSPARVLGNSKVHELLLERPRARILEIGAGCLRNAIHLQRQGFRVTVLESADVVARFPRQYADFERLGGTLVQTLRRPTLPRGRFDFALATFVFETICNPAARLKLLETCRRALIPAGVLVVSVRGVSDVVTKFASGVRCSDGYITSNKTFVRSFTKRQLVGLLNSAGFERVELLHRASSSAPELVHAIARTK